METVVDNPILAVSNLKKHFAVRGGFFDRVQRYVKAVDGVSFDLRPGETLGVVGESGCGKSTLARCCLWLDEPSGGQVVFSGRDLSTMDSGELQSTRAHMQMVYQDPYSSLDPRMTVWKIVAEPLMIHGLPPSEVDGRVVTMTRLVGLTESDLSKYPHMFSGGQRQRISVARALVLEPSLVVLDEPTSGLDVSVQARLLVLFQRLQRDLGLTYMFISHDIRTVNYISDRIAVMYLGHIVELGEARAVLEDPRHPYTRALLAAMPSAEPDRKLTDLVRLTGEVPDPSNVPPGCRFSPRCAQRRDTCTQTEPELRRIGLDHWVRCHAELNEY